MGARSQESSWQEELPTELHSLFFKYDWESVAIGRSGVHVFALDEGYIKISHQGRIFRDELLAEKERLTWLQGHLPVPEVYFYEQTPNYEYLFLSTIAGTIACEPIFAEKLPRLIQILAEALHMVHSLPITNCPFQQDISARLLAIKRLIASGRLDTEQFLARHQDLSPQDWYAQLEKLRPPTETLVFTHGDFCLPNILIDPQKMEISGLIDWGHAGIADYHQDLVDTCWSLGHNFSPDWIPTLQATYGQQLIDPKKLSFYRELDDLRSYL